MLKRILLFTGAQIIKGAVVYVVVKEASRVAIREVEDSKKKSSVPRAL